VAITVDAVAEWLGLKSWQSDTALPEVVAMVNAYVAGLPVVANTADPDTWSDAVTLGATMLAGRYYRRRNSPNGVEAITETGAQYVARYDSDISRLLQLDSYARPAIG
jgi:hypothetical protein